LKENRIFLFRSKDQKYTLKVSGYRKKADLQLHTIKVIVIEKKLLQLPYDRSLLTW
jgi:hypothetical protein